MIKTASFRENANALSGLLPLNLGHANPFCLLDRQSNRSSADRIRAAAHPSMKNRKVHGLAVTQMQALMQKVSMLSLEVIVDFKSFQLAHRCASAG
jgi:hypothetical protein